MRHFFILLLTCFISGYSQNLSLNNIDNYELIKFKQISGDSVLNSSLTQYPLSYKSLGIINTDYSNLGKFISRKGELKISSINLISEFNTKHPYNRNNGSFVPNKGYQQLISFGFYTSIGPLKIQFIPEYHYADNKKYNGFWEGHYPIIWQKRYNLWNHIDIPERFGKKRISNFMLGQSFVKFEFKNLSLGISNENLWWGPSFRNSIMMSNQSRSFPHISFKTENPVNTFLGKFEWQLVTGKLESSTFSPPNPDYTFAGTRLYVPKTNQLGQLNDWRYFQGIVISYSPKWFNGITLGFIRWSQVYSELIKANYTWIPGKINYFPVFGNLFRQKDRFADLEQETDQAAGLFIKWTYPKDKLELYFEYHLNDAKLNFRDLLLDSDHARGTTVGLKKVLSKNYYLRWEWTQLEQSASRLIRNAGSWYHHSRVRHGFTNFGEVMGAGIGPGSNSHYISIDKFEKNRRLGLGLEIIDQHNDFYYYAFEDSNDFRRYWKDLNFHFNYSQNFNKFSINLNFVFNKSLNYQWELVDSIEDYYVRGKDINNVHLNAKVCYFIF